MLLLRHAAKTRNLGRRSFQVPPSYRPETMRVDVLPFRRQVAIWLQSLRKNRLRQLQRKLIDLHFPQPRQVVVEEVLTPIGGENYLNEVVFRVENNPEYPTRHVVFVHGYGASLGCFARNFHLVDDLRSAHANYVVHFLDNLSFGLSSNPKLPAVAQRGYWSGIPRMDFLRMGPSPQPPVFYNKYYQLLEWYQVDEEGRQQHAREMAPVLRSMEDYYVNALEGWRHAWGIEQIDFLVGHSFGGYWSGCYAARHPKRLRNVVLLSPVGVERHAGAVTIQHSGLQNSVPQHSARKDQISKLPSTSEPSGSTPSSSTNNNDLHSSLSSVSDSHSSTEAHGSGPESGQFQIPSLDPTSYHFLGKLPNLSAKTINFWYSVQPYLPRLLKLMGPWGVQKYYRMWYSKLFAINSVVERLGGPAGVFTNAKQLVFGSNAEVQLLIEYLYNSITSGTRSDIHVKYLLTPATLSRWPLYDKLEAAEGLPTCHVIYGQYDFMCAEAGRKMVERLKERGFDASYHEVAQGGHNLYIQNPFGTNELLVRLFANEGKDNRTGSEIETKVE